MILALCIEHTLRHYKLHNIQYTMYFVHAAAHLCLSLKHCGNFQAFFYTSRVLLAFVSHRKNEVKHLLDHLMMQRASAISSTSAKSYRLKLQ